MPDLVFTSKGAAEAIRMQERLNAAAKDLQGVYRDDTRAAKELEQAATRIFRAVQNPSEQFNREMGKLLGNFKQGKVNAEQYEKGVKKLEAAYANANTLSGKLSGTVSNMFGSQQLGQLARYVTSLGSVAGVVTAITNEIRSQIDLIDKASATKLSTSASRNVVIRNLAGLPAAEQRRIIGENSALARQLGMSETPINLARAEALSASGGNVPASLAATKVAAQFLSDQPSEIGGFAGSLLDLSKVTGTTDANVNLGLLTQVASLSRVTSPASQAQNIPRALIGATAFGSTGSGAAALFSALTTGSGDIKGASSGTATIALAQQLSEFMSDDDSSKKIASLQEKREAALERVANAEEKLARAQESAAEQDTGAERRVSDAEARLSVAKMAKLKPGATAAQRKAAQDRISKASLDLERAQSDLLKQDASRRRSVSDAEGDLAQARGGVSEIDQQLSQFEASRGARQALRSKFAGMTTTERIMFLQQNPALAQEFLADASFEKVSLGPIQQLLTNAESDVSKQFRANLQAIPGNDRLGQLGADAISAFSQANTLETGAAVERRLGGLVEDLRLREPDNLGAEGRANLQEVIQRAGGKSNLGARITTLLGSLSDGSIGISTSEATNILAEEAKRLRASTFTQDYDPMTGTPLGPRVQVQNEATENALSSAKLLEEVVQVLRDQIKQQEEQINEQKETNRKLENSGLVAGGT